MTLAEAERAALRERRTTDVFHFAGGCGALRGHFAGTSRALRGHLRADFEDECSNEIHSHRITAATAEKEEVVPPRPASSDNFEVVVAYGLYFLPGGLPGGRKDNSFPTVFPIIYVENQQFSINSVLSLSFGGARLCAGPRMFSSNKTSPHPRRSFSLPNPFPFHHISHFIAY